MCAQESSDLCWALLVWEGDRTKALLLSARKPERRHLHTRDESPAYKWLVNAVSYSSISNYLALADKMDR